MLSMNLIAFGLLAGCVNAWTVPSWPPAWDNGRGSRGQQCGPAVVALATGIEINIVAQYGNTILYLVSSSPSNASLQAS